jgi:MATE family multidrug resistance protein
MALFIARFGAMWSGAHQIAANLAALCFMLPLAVGNASSVLVGQAIGARAPDRARATVRTALLIGLASGVIVGGLIFFAAAPVARLYTSEPAVQHAAAGLLAFVGIYHIFDAVQAVAANVVRGYKRAAVPMLIYCVALWGIGLGGGYLLGVGFPDSPIAPLGAYGFWLAAAVGIALAAVSMTIYLFRLSGVSAH